MPARSLRQFEVLRRIRERQEELRAQAHAAAERDVQAAVSQRASLEQQQRSALDEAGRRAREDLDANEIRLYYQYERHLARQIDDTDARITQLRQVAEVRRAELEDAMKRRRIVEKLIERTRRGLAAEALKAEQKFADEVAGNFATAALAARRRGLGEPLLSAPVFSEPMPDAEFGLAL